MTNCLPLTIHPPGKVNISFIDLALFKYCCFCESLYFLLTICLIDMQLLGVSGFPLVPFSSDSPLKVFHTTSNSPSVTGAYFVTIPTENRQTFSDSSPKMFWRFAKNKCITRSVVNPTLFFCFSIEQRNLLSMLYPIYMYIYR